MTNEESAQRGTRSLFERLTRADDPVFEQIDRNAKSLLQSALTRLDVVSREEFDAQAAVLKRTRERLGGAGSANRRPRRSAVGIRSAGRSVTQRRDQPRSGSGWATKATQRDQKIRKPQEIKDDPCTYH